MNSYRKITFGTWIFWIVVLFIPSMVISVLMAWVTCYYFKPDPAEEAAHVRSVSQLDLAQIFGEGTIVYDQERYEAYLMIQDTSSFGCRFIVRSVGLVPRVDGVRPPIGNNVLEEDWNAVFVLKQGGSTLLSEVYEIQAGLPLRSVKGVIINKGRSTVKEGLLRTFGISGLFLPINPILPGFFLDAIMFDGMVTIIIVLTIRSVRAKTRTVQK